MARSRKRKLISCKEAKALGYPFNFIKYYGDPESLGEYGVDLQYHYQDVVWGEAQKLLNNSLKVFGPIIKGEIIESSPTKIEVSGISILQTLSLEEQRSITNPTLRILNNYVKEAGGLVIIDDSSHIKSNQFRYITTVNAKERIECEELLLAAALYIFQVEKEVGQLFGDRLDAIGMSSWLLACCEEEPICNIPMFYEESHVIYCESEILFNSIKEYF